MLKPSDLPIKPGDAIPEALAWENFKMEFYGKEILQFTKFKISYKAEYDFNKGKGGHPVSYAIKEFKRECSASVYAEEMKPIIALAIAYGGDVTQLPPSPLVATATTDFGVLKMLVPLARISDFDVEFSQGKENVEVPIGIQLVSYPIITFT